MRKRQFLCYHNNLMCQRSFAHMLGRYCHPISNAAVQPYSTLGMQQEHFPRADWRQPQLVVPISQFMLYAL